MSLPELIESRVISGTGRLKVPLSDSDPSFVLFYLVEVVRFPTNLYQNRGYSPPRGRYATVNFLKEKFLIREEVIDYPAMMLKSENLERQVLTAVQCLGSALRGVYPLIDLSDVSRFRLPNMFESELRFVCYADTAIKVSAYKVELDSCDPLQRIPLPIDLPETVTPIPIGTPIEVSPPYDDDTSADFAPYPDDFLPPPPPPECESFSGVVSVPFAYLGGRVFTYPVSGLTPARIEVVAEGLGGSVTLKSSNCAGGVVVGEPYTLQTSLTAVGGGSPQTWYGTVTYNGTGNVPVVVL